MDVELYRVRDVMKALSLGRTTVYEYIRTGKIKVVRLGKSIRIARDELERLKREGIA
jgi:excisionase family DNA binding protein